MDDFSLEDLQAALVSAQEEKSTVRYTSHAVQMDQFSLAFGACANKCMQTPSSSLREQALGMQSLVTVCR